MASKLSAGPPMQPPIWKIEWSDALSVGIPQIDEDHKRFSRLVNELNRSIVDRAELIEVRRRLQLIIDDAGQHFAHEERLFKDWMYPDSESHAALHAQIINALQNILAGIDYPHQDKQWISAGLQIKAVLIDHILKDDAKYTKSYLNHRGPLPLS